MPRAIRRVDHRQPPGCGGPASGRRRALRVCLVLLAALVLFDSALEAVQLRKRMRRRFPGGWYPIPQTQYDPAFRATGPNAVFTFEAFLDTGDFSSLCIDNVAVVKRKYFRENQDLSQPLIDSPSDPGTCGPGSRLPAFERFFDVPASPSPSDVPFLEDFPDVSPPHPGWQPLAGTVELEDRLNDPPDNKCLALGAPGEDYAAVSVSVSNLVAGEIYTVVGWWYIDGGPAQLPLDLTIDGDVVEAKPILLVDDDDNAPDVQSAYTDALDAMGLDYSLFDPGAIDADPSATTLARYSTVLWFSGDKYLAGGTGPGPAGPAPAGEAALATFLDQGGCLVLSSQDYLWDANGGGPIPHLPTAFMASHLGVDSGVSDVFQTEVSGAPADDYFGGLGTLPLDYRQPDLQNYSDRLTPDGSAESAVALLGDPGNGNAGLYREVDNSATDIGYRTAYLGFPLEAIAGPGERLEALAAALKLCHLQCPLDCPQPADPPSCPPPAGVIPFHLSVENQVLSAGRRACNSIYLEAVTISGCVSLQSGNQVVLGNGVATAPGATLTIETGPIDQ